MLKALKHNGFRLSRCGNARQVVLLCHGGWNLTVSSNKKRADGYTMIPKGTVLYYYSEHGVSNAGYKCTQGVLLGGKGSYKGLCETYTAPPTPAGMSAVELQGLQTALAESQKTFDVNATRYVERVGDPTASRLVQTYNYNLAYEDRLNEEGIWTDHRLGIARGKPIDGDVDLLMLTSKYDHDGSKTTHLEHAFEAVRRMTGGYDYPVFHYAPCRYIEPGKWYEHLGKGYGQARS